MGELQAFCRDFNFKMPKSQVKEIYKKFSPTQHELDYETFQLTFNDLADATIENMTLEIKNRLRVIK